MNITIDIKPEVRAELLRRGAEHGRDLDAYAPSLLEDAAHVPDSSNTLSQSELEVTLRELAQFSHKIPSLPEEAFSRESLYRDHD